MRAQVAMSLFLKALGVWLVVNGTVHMPSTIGSMVSYWPHAPATGGTLVAPVDYQSVLVGNLLTEVLRIAMGCGLLAFADRLAAWVCRESATAD